MSERYDGPRKYLCGSLMIMICRQCAQKKLAATNLPAWVKVLATIGVHRARAGEGVCACCGRTSSLIMLPADEQETTERAPTN